MTFILLVAAFLMIVWGWRGIIVGANLVAAIVGLFIAYGGLKVILDDYNIGPCTHAVQWVCK